MQDEKTKLETVKRYLAEQFTASRARSVGNVIRLNTPALKDGDIVVLGVLSIDLACDVQVKRSGTGLAVIVTI